MTRKRYSELTRAARRRLVAAAMLRSATTITLLVAVYYTAPLDRPLDPGTWLWFGLGLLAFTAVISWQVRAIMRTTHELARIVAVTRMLVGLTALGLIAKVLLGAVDVAVRRHEAEPLQPPAPPPSRAAGGDPPPSAPRGTASPRRDEAVLRAVRHGSRRRPGRGDHGGKAARVRSRRWTAVVTVAARRAPLRPTDPDHRARTS